MSVVKRKRQARIQRMYDAAAKLFAEHGFHATRMEDIAARLDLQKGSLYYYFDSKESLLAKLVEERVGVAVAALDEIVSSDAAPIDKLRRAVNSHLAVFQEHADAYKIFVTERLSSISSEAAAVVDAMGREYERLWGRLLDEGSVAGHIREDLDRGLAVKAVIGMCNSTLFWLSPAGRLSTEEVADQFADIIIRGIAVE